VQGLGGFRLGWKKSRYLVYDTSHSIYRKRMRTYQHTAFTVLDRYDI
jgi:hypothetical protein